MFLPKFFQIQQDALVIEFSPEEITQMRELKNKSQIVKSRKTKPANFHSGTKSKSKKEILPEGPFDPDTMSNEAWQTLGLSQRQSEVLISYKERLGGFYNIDQLYSAYVLDSNRVNSWQPYLVFNRKKPAERKIEINSASAEELKSLKGIGEKLSERIITYREKLGGFVNVEQISEVYGLSPDTFEAIRSKLSVDHKKVIQIKINEIEMKELAAHPYFTFQMAKLIVNYRLHHGPYYSMDELLKSKGIEIEDVKKVEPYINFAP